MKKLEYMLFRIGKFDQIRKIKQNLSRRPKMMKEVIEENVYGLLREIESGELGLKIRNQIENEC